MQVWIIKNRFKTGLDNKKKPRKKSLLSKMANCGGIYFKAKIIFF